MLRLRLLASLLVWMAAVPPAAAQAPIVHCVPDQAPPEPAWHVNVEYLIWWLRDGYLPPLLTTGPPDSRGIIGLPGTVILYGGERVDTERHSIAGRHFGIRVVAGCWLNEDQTLGLEGSAFFLERDSSNYSLKTPDEIPLLARPYVSIFTGNQAEIFHGPVPGDGDRLGSFNAFTKVELFGEDLNLVFPWVAAPEGRLDLLAGAHFLQMRERLDVTATGRLLPDEAIQYGVSDHFRTFTSSMAANSASEGNTARGRGS